MTITVLSTQRIPFTFSVPGELPGEILETGSWSATQNNVLALSSSAMVGGEIYIEEYEVFIHDISSTKMIQVVDNLYAHQYTKQ